MRRHQKLINKMTMEEKAAFLSGKSEWESRDIPRLNIPSVVFSDGPHGIRRQEGAGDHLGLNASLPATCFPTAAAVANSWNESLGEEIGQALGEEAAVQGVNILLGPGLNMKRSPLCGRNFEYFSEDPYLAGKLAAAYIRGIQSQGTAACPKHFAVNSQEERRMAMNSVLDERTLREIYLTGFEIAVKEGNPRSIMTSYNEINGVYANENRHLLQDILRKEWGFDGFVVTDWGASNDHVKGVAAGSNLEMPNPGLNSAREILQAVNDGTLTTDEVDDCVEELLDVVLELKENSKEKKQVFQEKEHHALARRAAAESAVLLKNQGNILPLRPGSRVAFIGDFAFDPRYQGAGSSMVNPTHIESIEKEADAYDLQIIGMNRGYGRNGGEDAVIKKNALNLAQSADVVVYCFGLNEISESEGLDRSHMRIPQNQIELLEAVAQVNPNIVGLISAGSAIEMPWHVYCRAILHGYLCGQAGASAALDILTGKVNPSGRLAETYPLRYEDTPACRNFPAAERNAQYREALYIGYRYYDTIKARVQYPFGFGLSYTEFAYTDITVDYKGVTCKITNTGQMDGAEVVQMYVGLPNAIVFRPARELKGFARIYLKAGECREVSIPFDDKTFRYWNVKTNRWETEGGTYQIMLGASVADIRLQTKLELHGTTTDYPYNPAHMQYYYTGIVQQVSDREFETLLGHPLPSGKWSGELQLNDAICQMYYAKSSLARWICNRLTAMKNKSEEAGKPDLNILFIYNMPFRALAKMTGGMVSMKMVQGILKAVNGHFLKGMGMMLRAFLSDRKENRAYERMLSGKKR